MKGKVWDYPTRILVESESDSEDAYLVDLVEFKVGDQYNGSCQCKHFICDLRPRLRNPDNTSLYRCKHLRWAREHALDFVLPHMAANDPNIKEEHQT